MMADLGHCNVFSALCTMGYRALRRCVVHKLSQECCMSSSQSCFAPMGRAPSARRGFEHPREWAHVRSLPAAENVTTAVLSYLAFAFLFP